MLVIDLDIIMFNLIEQNKVTSSMENQPIAILTDSTCDILDDLIQQYNNQVIPQIIIWGNTQSLDRVDMQPNEFYELLINTTGLGALALCGYCEG